MPIIQVFHNPHFLDYDGSHSRIVPPVRPTASVNIAAAGLELNDMLGAAYAWTQHGYLYPSWFNDPAVTPHLRSTSVGDLLATEDGALYVVESFGFQAYRPKAISPIHKLAEAYRLLDAAGNRLSGAGDGILVTAVQQALAAMEHLLVAEGHPTGDTPILWDNAQVGDVVGRPEMGQFRVIARRLRPKWRAKRLLPHVPGSQLWLDGARHWAVLVPVSETTVA
ncbi:MAG: hypothetical protein IPJ94_11130 [Chloroflexi bacterium]|nr:hypothetical protein [Chloroflexota bacterium]